MTGNAPNTAVRILATLALVVTAYFLQYVVSILLLFFAGIVLAVLLDAITGAAERVLPGGRNVGLVAMALILALTLAGVLLLIVPPLVTQVPELIQSLPEAWTTLRDRLQRHDLLQPIMSQIGNPSQWLQESGVLGRITGILSGTFNFVVNVIIIGFLGAYLAVSPEAHSRVMLYPLRPPQQRAGRRLFTEAGKDLRHWLAGRAISMLTVGIVSGLGLWLLGVRLAFTLGLLAGMFSFVPYLGPIIAVLPALLIAASQSMALAGMVGLLYFVIQAVESYLLTPLVQQRAVSLPPAWLLLAQILGGVFGGVLGVVFAAPLVVTGATAVRVLYVEPRDDGEVAGASAG